MHRSLVVYTLACITLLLCLAPTADACSCLDPGPPCQSYGAATAVFSGRVTEITSLTKDDKSPKGYGQRLVTFTVNQSYRGISGTAAKTITGSGGGDCGYPFKVGESYLVYAYQNSHDNLEVPAKGNITDIKLVLTEPNGSCEKCRDWTRRKSQ